MASSSWRAACRGLLRMLPGRPAELPRFRAAVAAALRRPLSPAQPAPTAESATVVLREVNFLLRSQQELAELNERYFPQSGMSQQDIVKATAARVGLAMPKETGNGGEAGDAPTPTAG